MNPQKLIDNFNCDVKTDELITMYHGDPNNLSWNTNNYRMEVNKNLDECQNTLSKMPECQNQCNCLSNMRDNLNRIVCGQEGDKTALKCNIREFLRLCNLDKPRFINILYKFDDMFPSSTGQHDLLIFLQQNIIQITQNLMLQQNNANQQANINVIHESQ